jgi:hypothetical protein
MIQAAEQSPEQSLDVYPEKASLPHLSEENFVKIVILCYFSREIASKSPTHGHPAAGGRKATGVRESWV